MTLNDVEGHLLVSGLFKCKSFTLFFCSLQDFSWLARIAQSLSDSWASCVLYPLKYILKVEARVVIFCVIAGYIGRLTILERGVARVMWPVLEFCTPLNFSGMAEGRIVKFCALVGQRSIIL